MKPAISVLLPTRNRPEHLRKSIASLRDLATDPAQVEILLAVDNDDTETPALTTEIDAFFNYRVIRGPRHGYENLHIYYNDLATASSGDWMLVWNDDAEMLTENWDSLLKRSPPYSIQWIRRDKVATADFTFFAIGRGVFEALESRLSAHLCLDTWLYVVSRLSNTCIIRDDIVFHHHRLPDQTASETIDFDGKRMERFEAMQAQRENDANRVIADPKHGSRFLGYQIKETASTGVFTLVLP